MARLGHTARVYYRSLKRVAIPARLELERRQLITHRAALGAARACTLRAGRAGAAFSIKPAAFVIRDPFHEVALIADATSGAVTHSGERVWTRSAIRRGALGCIRADLSARGYQGV